MLNNLSSIDNQGLSYAILEGYIHKTNDEEFNEALELAKNSIMVIQRKMNEFENDLDDGMYDEHI